MVRRDHQWQEPMMYPYLRRSHHHQYYQIMMLRLLVREKVAVVAATAMAVNRILMVAIQELVIAVEYLMRTVFLDLDFLLEYLLRMMAAEFAVVAGQTEFLQAWVELIS
jgi:hypothetical protein